MPPLGHARSAHREPWVPASVAPLEGLIRGLERRRVDRSADPTGGVACHVVQEARGARHAGWPAGVHPLLVDGLRRRGIEAPYTHQALAIEHALAGRDVVVTSPTASGKTLCYAVPVLTTCLREPDARALLVFPTKALALDQVEGLRQLVASLDEDEESSAARQQELAACTFDGDTPADVRRLVRQRGRLVVTNPDMLHSGILPHHARWSSLFEGLRHVVIDELHAYRGLFGSHVANVLRRLQRVAAFHGSRPTFVMASATIANAREHAQALLGREVVEVSEDGAPRGRKHVVFYNPPVIDARLGLRAGPMGTTRRLAARSIVSGLQTIVFATSRLSVEILTKYLKDALVRARRSASLVEGYRGGYLPGQRRRVQSELRQGKLRGVVATNALELGIDVGSLDVAILCGYPGSIASTLQQMGRAGRRASTSACVLVARGTALDQYVMSHPEYFFGSSPEHARIDPDNLLVLTDHVKCAAFELPFREGETYGRLDPAMTRELLGILAEEGLVHEERGTWHWTSETHPAEAVSLRSVSSDNFVVVDTGGPSPKVIAEVDFPSAPSTIHEKAIYMVGARQYQVDRLDYDGRKAYVTPVSCDYYTDAETHRSVAVLAVFESRRQAAGAAVVVRHGEVKVARKVVGFKKVRFYTLENLGYGDVSLPEHEMHTVSYWLTLKERAVSELVLGGLTRPQVVGGLSGAAVALHAVATVCLACDGRDVESALGDPRGTGLPGAAGRWDPRADAGGDARAEAGGEPPFEPTLFLYDNSPGGTGFAPLLFDRHEDIVRGALEIVSRCACATGCPACVGPAGPGAPGVRDAARRILELLAREAQAGVPPAADSAGPWLTGPTQEAAT